MDPRKAAVALGLILASCGAPKPRPAPPPPTSAPPSPAPPPPADWADLPLTAGAWRYAQADGESSAGFGATAATPELVVRCHRVSHTITLARSGAAGPLTIRTSYATRVLPAPTGTALLPANDPFLDGIAFSRGRFTIAAAKVPMLVVPAWAEPGRVIEDCRA